MGSGVLLATTGAGAGGSLWFTRPLPTISRAGEGGWVCVRVGERNQGTTLRERGLGPGSHSVMTVSCRVTRLEVDRTRDSSRSSTEPVLPTFPFLV